MNEQEMVEMVFRAFIAVDVDQVQGLVDFHHDLSNVGPGLKPVEIGLVHITLKFLGEVEEKLVPEIEVVMREAVVDIAPFELRMQGAGAFPPRSSLRVVWAGLMGTEVLGTIAARLDKGLARLGFAPDERPFSPHLTLARVKDPRASFAASTVVQKFKDQDFGVQSVRSIKLKRSELTRSGPVYSTVLDVPFH